MKSRLAHKVTNKRDPKITPNIERLSCGLYTLASNKLVLDKLKQTTTVLVDSVPRACKEALVQCIITSDGTITVTGCGYLFSEKNYDVFERVVPPRDSPDADIVRLGKTFLVTLLKNGIQFRVNIANLTTTNVTEDIEVVEERLGYALLDKIPNNYITIELLSIAFCVQGCIKPSKATTEQLCNAMKQPKLAIWKVNGYRSLKYRQKHDNRTNETTNAPYEVYDNNLVKCDLDPNSDEIRDSELYLLVPPCADPRMCLLRKSLRMLDEVEVQKFVCRYGPNIETTMWTNNMKLVLPITGIEKLLLDTITDTQIIELCEMFDVPRDCWGWSRSSRLLDPPTWDAKSLLRYVQKILLNYRIKKPVE
jgi:hypothetical protein